MYEAFFTLQRRPFAATPDAGCWFHDGPHQAALDELVICAEQGQGIGVLTAPAGAGKTLVCERLVQELRHRFATVLLRHATFSTRRALLQTILCDQDRPFDKLSDQELRLSVAKWLRELQQSGRALAVVVDEAHELSEAVLEELRILSDHAHAGRPLVRLILVGQLSLEEKLALPGAQALNQRIRAQVVLPTLTQAESADYIDYRITWAGGRTRELFTAEALDMVCRAADGVPRCLNQLCDHALLLAYVHEQRPVSPQMVTDALSDLSHLPLPWNPLPQRVAEPAMVNATSAVFRDFGSLEQTLVEIPEVSEDFGNLGQEGERDARHSEMPGGEEVEERQESIYRLSRRLLKHSAEELSAPVFADATPPFWNADDEQPLTDDGFREEVVVDRYAALDAGLEPPVEPPRSTYAAPQSATTPWATLWTEAGAPEQLTQRIDAVQHVLAAVAAADDEPLIPWGTTDRATKFAESRPIGDETLEGELGATVLELCADTQGALVQDHPSLPVPTTVREVEPRTSECEAVFEFGADIASADHSPTPAAERSDSTVRPYRNLFTQLRRKQQGRA